MVKTKGIVKKVLSHSAKCVIYNVELNEEVNGKTKKCWINVIQFTPSMILVEGAELDINGYLHSNCYEKAGEKIYTTEIVQY